METTKAAGVAAVVADVASVPRRNTWTAMRKMPRSPPQKARRKHASPANLENHGNPGASAAIAIRARHLCRVRALA